MDGDQRIKHLQQLMAQSSNTARGRVMNRFEQATRARGNPTGISQAPDRTTMSYDYGYTGNAFPSDLQVCNRIWRTSSKNIITPPQQQQTSPGSTQQLNRRRANAETIPLVPYDSGMLYSFGSQQGPAHGAFDVVPQYSTRQSAGMEALSNQMPISQYFTDDAAGSGVPGLSPYLNALSYNEPGPMARSSTAQPFPTTLAEFTPMEIGSSTRLDPSALSSGLDQPAIECHLKSLTDPLDHPEYQRALCSTFDRIRAGRLIEASKSLLKISEWLVTNARDLGILSDNHKQHPRRLQFWNDFNICWLALCQKQKNLTQDVMTMGHPSSQTSLLSRDRMEALGKDLIQLCDQLEQHGLVDYQMGIWEEEILSDPKMQTPPPSFSASNSDSSLSLRAQCTSTNARIPLKAERNPTQWKRGGAARLMTD
ncbi:hypothetical protein POX_c04688 [Penicillium oxalicum]|uniref:hypothetical protein n=1 Tax=Penicillium oxalicum TaxID=69781 RepID=UPI0020B6FE85|nr:hypothetical protein POX_c04688 [Penicillium oxalicum]KAI2791809.1 hypothetical protein POX_c04688 [Penicillium oxalicum]